MNRTTVQTVIVRHLKVGEVWSSIEACSGGLWLKQGMNKVWLGSLSNLDDTINALVDFKVDLIDDLPVVG